MSVYEFHTSAQPIPKTDDWRILNFDATRAGRAVANAALIAISVHGFNWSQSVPRLRPDLQSGAAPYRTWDELGLRPLSTLDPPVETTPGMIETAKELDAGLVSWFTKHQEEAERSLEQAAPVDAPEPEDEPILTSGRRRSSSWRGGGTMQRR